ncbi:hypothetical protein MOSL_0367 [Moraxella osloensis]|nr:SEC-C metal-binding domain-containing protein [Moraxella osloensis]MDI4481193.1 hypothetical protein [Moraxella osloensis]BAV10940.1 hypothetical protein MOSL_0367 [Moraxella osloensis]
MDSLPNEEKMDFFRNYKDSEMRNSTVKELERIYEETEVEFGSSLFNIVKNKLPNEILETLSIRLGENTDFKQGKISYFLNNDTQIYDKPFIKLGEEYHCYNSPVIYYKLQNLLENILLNTIPANKHQKLYFAKKGEYLEEKSLELLESVLPNSKIFKNLKYGVNFEVDGIVIFDDNIFIVESKSNKFTIGAKKGNIEKIKTDTKNIVEKAYQQATRAKKFILENDVSEFKDKNGKVVLKLEKKDFNNIYLINTTLEPLNRLSTDLSSLKSFGFLQEDEWIWSVYLNDLRVICEILDSPSEFLLYVNRRIKYNNFPQVKMADELDVFGYFLERGLYFDDIEFPKSNFMLTIDHSYAHDVDLYYYWKEGSIFKEIKKPSLYGKMKNIKYLVKDIENLNKSGATRLGKILLNFDGNTQDFIHQQIKLMKEYRRSDFHIPISDENIGIYFIQQKLSEIRNVKEMCEIYAYERKINHWYVVVIGVDGLVDFNQLKFNSDYNERLENEVKELRQFRFEQVADIGKKIGRNDVCPCGSGKKYKKCCLK